MLRSKMVEFKNKVSRRIYACFPHMKFRKTKDRIKDRKIVFLANTDP